LLQRETLPEQRSEKNKSNFAFHQLQTH